MAFMTKERRPDGYVWIDCARCGNEFPGWKAGDYGSEVIEKLYSDDSRRYCLSCQAELNREARAREFRAQLPDRYEAAGIAELYRCDRVTGEPLTAPPVPRVAEFFLKNRGRCLLVSGPTGVGKSTSACWAAMKLIEEGKRVRYVKLRKLLAEWRDARTSGEPYADEAFYAAIAKLDVLILDEVADKVKMTETGQEMLYEVLDQIYDGEMRTHLWILGNFRAGVLAELFGDTEPVYRRIEETFLCVGIDQQSIEQIHVWQSR